MSLELYIRGQNFRGNYRGTRHNSHKRNAMTRLRRVILAALTILSLFLFLTTIVFWPRSYARNYLLTLITNRRAIELATGRGRVLLHAE